MLYAIEVIERGLLPIEKKLNVAIAVTSVVAAIVAGQNFEAGDVFWTVSVGLFVVGQIVARRPFTRPENEKESLL